MSDLTDSGTCSGFGSNVLERHGRRLVDGMGHFCCASNAHGAFLKRRKSLSTYFAMRYLERTLLCKQKDPKIETFSAHKTFQPKPQRVQDSRIVRATNGRVRWWAVFVEKQCRLNNFSVTLSDKYNLDPLFSLTGIAIYSGSPISTGRKPRTNGEKYKEKKCITCHLLLIHIALHRPSIKHLGILSVDIIVVLGTPIHRQQQQQQQQVLFFFPSILIILDGVVKLEQLEYLDEKGER